MKPTRRWPLHPAPRDGESLSSWLHRVAHRYDMDLHDLLHYEFGIVAADRLDIDPSTELLETLSARSGLPRDRLKIMSVAGWVPWLLDTMNADAGGFDTYVRQFSVLVSPGRRFVRKAGPWRAWWPEQTTYRACPECLGRRPADCFLKLTWRLPLMLTCPAHRCRLRLCYASHGRFFGWSEKRSKLPPDPAFLAMDRRTAQALDEGRVQLPGRRIHAALWFRLLRTIIDELMVSLAVHPPSQSRTIQMIWERSGYPIRAGKAHWYPFEQLAWPAQEMLLETAAVAIHLIETGQVSAAGEQRSWFRSAPPVAVDDGKRPDPVYPAVNYWQEAMKAAEDLFAEAKTKPEAAEALFSLFMLGRQDEARVRETEGFLCELEIPLELVSRLSTRYRSRDIVRKTG